ncbi:MAG: extracellular solute-binding protein [Butyricicoccus sp.]
MKKTLAMLLATAMLAGSLAGCGGGSTASGSSGAPAQSSGSSASSEKPAEKVTLTIAARGGSHVDVINAVKGAFEAENNCTIEVLGLESADLKQKVSLDAKNKQGAYDLLMIDDPWMPEFCEAGMLYNLTAAGYTDDADFVKQSLDIGKYPYAEGDTYALPFAGNVTLLFYNQEVLDSVNAEVPDNWEDLLAVATQVKGSGKLGYVVRGQQGNPIVGDYLPLLWAYGGDVFDADWNVTVDSPEAKQALEMYLKIAAQGDNYEKNDIVAAVSDGNAAMSLGWPSWYISSGSSAAGYAKIPSKVSASSAANRAGVIGNWMMAVTANSTHPDLAVKLLEYLTSAETQKAAADAGAVPTRTSVFTDTELVAKYPYYTTLLEATQESNIRPRTPLWSEVENVYGIELSNALSGTKSVDQALADAKTAIEQVMQ